MNRKPIKPRHIKPFVSSANDTHSSFSRNQSQKKPAGKREATRACAKGKSSRPPLFPPISHRAQSSSRDAFFPPPLPLTRFDERTRAALIARIHKKERGKEEGERTWRGLMRRMANSCSRGRYCLSCAPDVLRPGYETTVLCCDRGMEGENVWERESEVGEVRSLSLVFCAGVSFLPRCPFSGGTRYCLKTQHGFCPDEWEPFWGGRM